MPQYTILTNVQSHFVKPDNRILGAYGTNFWRSWIYPFYTPSGRTVVENSPFDHLLSFAGGGGYRTASARVSRASAEIFTL